METNTIMIGDWVNSTIEGNGRITRIERDGFLAITYGNQQNAVICKSYDLIPIPLTTEILERNGFKEYNGYGYASNKGYGFKEFYINNDFSIKIANINCKINYIHELQHALKLCGIEKDIQL